MNAIYELDTKWKEILDAKDFLGGLTVNEFVSELSKDEIQKQNLLSNGSFSGVSQLELDPKPFIRTFESVLKELKKLQKDMHSKSSQLSKQVSQIEVIHAKKTLRLNEELKEIVDDFDGLDHKLSNVTQVVSPLGTKLERSIRKKNSYIKSVELVTYYASIYETGKCEELNELLLSNDWKSMLCGSMVLKSLLSLAKKIDTRSMPKTLEVSSAIESLANSFEAQILSAFNEAYRENNFQHLSHLACVLNRYNNGVNVIKNFIEQHEYFSEASNGFDKNITSILTDEEFKSNLSNPDIHPLHVDHKIASYTNQVFSVIKDESMIVSKVFDSKTPLVMSLFIEKVFAEKLRPLLTFLLNSSLSLSSLAYIRSLHGYYSVLNSLVKELTEFFANTGLDDDSKLSMCLEKLLKSLFSDILFDQSKYFEVEKRTLESILAQKTSDFNVLYEKEIRQRGLSNKLNDCKDYHMLPELQYLSSQQSSRFSQLNSYIKNKLERRLEHENSEVSSNVQSKEYNDTFTLLNVDSMLKYSVESLARVMELVPSRAGYFTLELVQIFMIGVMDSFIEAGLEVSYQQLFNLDTSRDTFLDFSFLRNISKATEMISVVSTYFKSIVLPLLQNSSEIKNQVISLVNAYFRRSELLINVLLESTVNMLSNKFIFVLSKQKKKDFLSKSQELLDHDTETTAELVAVLNQVQVEARIYLKNENLISFLENVGEQLFDLLLKHYRKFQVSSTGGVIVTKDIISYQTTVESWNVPQLIEKFAILRELSNLFTVQPELLQSLTNEGHLTNFDRSIIDEYISKREDYNQDGFMKKFKATIRN